MRASLRRRTICLLFLGLLLAGCSSRQHLIAEPQQSLLHAVSCAPQLPVDPPAGFVPLESEATARTASYALDGLLRSGPEFETGLRSRVTAFSGAAWFNPAADSSSTDLTDYAFCAYRFALDDYSLSGKPQTLAVQWSTGSQPDPAQLWVALANWNAGHWDWYAGPDDGVITLASLAPYTSQAGEALVLVLLGGTADADLEALRFGEPETRATGAIQVAAGTDLTPPLAGGGNLPFSVDLAPECAPILNQGQIPSCTAFAIGGGAFNHALGRAYANCNWDLADPAMQASPKFIYVETGPDQGLGCPDDGRRTDEVLQYLIANGCSSEEHAPYEYDYCDDDWSSAALDDAQVLEIAGFKPVAHAGAAGRDRLRSILALQRRPIVFQIAVDPAFKSYQTGDWDFTGPVIGLHAMCIVGYSDSRDAFKVRNSWGEYWGEDGHIWIDYATFEDNDPDAAIACWTLSVDCRQDVADRFCGLGMLPAPANVQASDGAFENFVRVTWSSVSGATSYHIYRDTMDDPPAATVGAAQVSWDDTGITDQLGHSYWVVAESASQTSAFGGPDVGWKGEPTGWVHSFGGDAYSQGWAIATDQAGNVYTTGYTRAFGAGGDDIVVISYAADGSFRWARTYGTAGGDAANDIEVDGDGNIWVAAYLNRSVIDWRHHSVLLKYDSDGNLLLDIGWRPNHLDDSLESEFNGLKVAGNNVYCVGSWFVNDASADNEWTIAKFDLSGSLLWSRGWDAVFSDKAWDAVVDSDGYVTVIGEIGDNTGGSEDCAVVQFDAAGNLRWEKTWATSDTDVLLNAALGPGDEIYCAGYTNGYRDGDALLLKVSSTGALAWANAWGSDGWSQLGYATAIGPDGNIYLCGDDGSMFAGCALVEFSPAGGLLSERTWDTDNSATGKGLAFSPDGYALLSGVASDAQGAWEPVVTTVVSPGQNLDDLNGAVTSLGTTTFNATGGQSTPVDPVHDTGGGWSDVLTMKVSIE